MNDSLIHCGVVCCQATTVGPFTGWACYLFCTY